MARAMKDSGIAWIGEIPEDWKVLSLKYLCTMQAVINTAIKYTKNHYEKREKNGIIRVWK